MDKISRLYKSLSDNQRYNFWSAATNLFLCMFTFWLGITIQFIVVDKTIDYQLENERIEFMKYVEPHYNNLILANKYIGENMINQEMYELLLKKEKEPSMEAINIYKKHMAQFNSNYREIMSNVDQFIESTMLLKYTISDEIKRNDINTHVNMIRDNKFILDIIKSDDVHIDSIEYVIKEYYTSNEFAIGTKSFTSFITTEKLEDIIINPIKEIRRQMQSINTEKTKIMIAYYFFSSVTYTHILEVCKIYENELYGGSKEVSISQWWNNVPLFYKSFLVLICTIVIGYLFCRWFLFKLSLPSNPKRDYTVQEYRSLKKERDNVYKIFENQNEIKRLREEITKNNISLRKVYKHEDEIRLLEKLTKEKDIKIKTLEEEIKKIEEEINNINK